MKRGGVAAAALLGFSLSAPSFAGDSYALVVTGASGGESYAAKYAAWRLGIIASPECRLPLAPLNDSTMKVVDEALARVGALKAKAAE